MNNKFSVAARTAAVVVLSLICAFYAWLSFIAPIAAGASLAAPILLLYLLPLILLITVPFYFLFRYLFNRFVITRRAAWLAYGFVALNIIYVFVAFMPASANGDMFSAQLVVAGPTKLGGKLNYEIKPRWGAFYIHQPIINIDLKKPDGTVKESLRAFTGSCGLYLLTQICTPRNSYPETFAIQGQEILDETGTYMLYSDSPKVTPATFTVSE